MNSCQCQKFYIDLRLVCVFSFPSSQTPPTTTTTTAKKKITSHFPRSTALPVGYSCEELLDSRGADNSDWGDNRHLHTAESATQTVQMKCRVSPDADTRNQSSSIVRRTPAFRDSRLLQFVRRSMSLSSASQGVEGGRARRVARWPVRFRSPGGGWGTHDVQHSLAREFTLMPFWHIKCAKKEINR